MVALKPEVDIGKRICSIYFSVKLLDYLVVPERGVLN